MKSPYIHNLPSTSPQDSNVVSPVDIPAQQVPCRPLPSSGFTYLYRIPWESVLTTFSQILQLVCSRIL